MKWFIKPFLVLIFASTLIFSIYWLWQRQPKSSNLEPIKKVADVVTGKNDRQTKTENAFSLNIENNQIFSDPKLKIQGKATKGSSILIFSNLAETLLQSLQEDSFETELTLEKNLNIISIVEVDNNLTETKQKTYTIYLKDKNSQINATTMYAGNVKNIFNNLVTLTTLDGEKKVKIESSTQLSLAKATASPTPKSKQQSTPEKVEVRVGDYIIALGQGTQEELKASSVDIIRENKPDFLKKYAPVTLTSTVKSNIFSARSIKDTSLMEFTLDKNSKIYNTLKLADAKAISKDKKALIFYKTATGNIVTSLYLLP